MHVDLANIQAICDWLGSTTLIELYSFLRLSNFYHRFMLGFSHIVWDLSPVSKGGGKSKFVWAKSQ